MIYHACKYCIDVIRNFVPPCGKTTIPYHFKPHQAIPNSIANKQLQCQMCKHMYVKLYIFVHNDSTDSLDFISGIYHYSMFVHPQCHAVCNLYYATFLFSALSSIAK